MPASKKKKLVIVESPTKAKTIGRHLGRNYQVIASKGHIRDLPKSQMGVDIENDYQPKYISIRGKGPTIKELKSAAKKSSYVYLASDPDREGEAIAWHVAHALDLDTSEKNRVTFNEITKDAVKASFKNPRTIDMDIVDAQQARRVLDRLVGYSLSPILWAKVKKGLSAGRVQSITLKLVIDREKEIKNFKPEEYWTIDAQFAKGHKQFASQTTRPCKRSWPSSTKNRTSKSPRSLPASASGSRTHRLRLLPCSKRLTSAWATGPTGP